MDKSDPKAAILSTLDEIIVLVESLLANTSLPKDCRFNVNIMNHTSRHLHELISDAPGLEALSQASSEVRTPLNSIRGFPKLMLLEPPIYQGDLSDEQREKLQKIADLGDDLHRLIETEIFHTIPRG